MVATRMIEKLQGYYAILDIKEASTDLTTLLVRAETLLSGKPCCLQLRAKALETAQWMECARQLQALCRARDVLFVVNDRLDVGLALDVDGVHLGQEDLGLRQALSLRGQKARPILGISTHDLAQAQDAANLGADYLGFGPVYSTRSKREAGSARGVSALAQVVLAVPIPVVAIGGITLENVNAVVDAGACAAQSSLRSMMLPTRPPLAEPLVNHLNFYGQNEFKIVPFGEARSDRKIRG